jgi:pyruvate dehydrogenase E2 component (dihydrolipoamide acetyltransferase)
MATELRMPDMGTVEGVVTLVRWLKAEGDTVSLGEPLFEVETDKGVSEVEAALAGVLVTILVAEGGKAGAGEPIALIQRPGDEAGPSAAKGAASTAARATTAPAAAPAPAAASAPAPAPDDAAAVAAPHGEPRVGPAIRALAERYGVDLSQVKATGPGGRITRDDVLRARNAASGRGSQRTGREGPAAPAAPGGASVRSALSHGQSIVAKKVSQSHREKPVYRVCVSVDMGKAAAFRQQSKAAGRAVSWDAILVKAAALALNEAPVLRRWMRGDDVAEHPDSDVAVAVAVGDDLYVPAVRAPAGKSAAAVSAEIERLAVKAAAHSLGPADVEGSCILVSNLGMFPVDSFDAIVYPEHSAALAVGAAVPTPVSDGTRIWIASVARLTLSVDHRLVNGRTAALYISRVKEILEQGAFE